MKKAFTLVELLVVMAIMAILTVVTVSQFRMAQRRANDVARKGDLGAVAKALQMYFADYGVMPDMDDPLGGQLEVEGKVIPWGEEFEDASGYVYMKTLPLEKGPVPYCYKTDDTKKKYALFAALEIGMDGQCDRDGDGIGDYTYDCGESTNAYCFAYVSPNTSLDEDGTFE